MTLSISDQNKLDSFWSYCVKNQYFNVSYLIIWVRSSS